MEDDDDSGKKEKKKSAKKKWSEMTTQFTNAKQNSKFGYILIQCSMDIAIAIGLSHVVFLQAARSLPQEDL